VPNFGHGKLGKVMESHGILKASKSTNSVTGNAFANGYRTGTERVQNGYRMDTERKWNGYGTLTDHKKGKL